MERKTSLDVDHHVIVKINICKEYFKLLVQRDREKQFNKKVEINQEVNSFADRHKIVGPAGGSNLYKVDGDPVGYRTPDYRTLANGLLSHAGYKYRTF